MYPNQQQQQYQPQYQPQQQQQQYQPHQQHQPMYIKNRVVDESKYRCCCNVHVEKAAYAIAFLGALLAVISAVVYFVGGNIGYGVMALANFLVYFSILYAQSQRSPGLYWPFLILNGLINLMLLCYVVYLIYLYVSMPYWYLDEVRGKWRRDGWSYPEYEFQKYVRVTLALYGAGMLIYTALCIWFWTWVYRAYDFMQVQNAQAPAPGYLAQRA